VQSSLEIAQAHQLIPIEEIAERGGVLREELAPYGRYKAKIALSVLERLKGAPDAKLVCVAGMTPTRAGEGNTTTLISLTDGLAVIGKHPVACLREPSLGPALGVKGGAAGGGRAQAVPMEDLNLHFTGDVHAIGAANNLLAAMIDASILHGNPHRIDALQVPWRRAVDMNDRALRKITVGLKGRANGYPRQTGFDITAASEVMAIVAVARDLPDLRRRLGRITPAYSYGGGGPVTAEDLGAAGAMTVLLKDALKPNLVQTLGGQPVMVHCGPFGNIDHGNNSLIADLVAMKLGDYVITESGFGSDMGMEKFFNIVCRFGRLTPSAVVLVITLRAIKHHGGLSEAAPVGRRASVEAIAAGMANVRRHLAIISAFGVPAVVAINQRSGDRKAELELCKRLAVDAGAVAAEISDGFAHTAGSGQPISRKPSSTRANSRVAFAPCTPTNSRSRTRSKRSRPASTAPRTCSSIPRPSTRSPSSRRIGSGGFLSASPRPTSLCPPNHRCSTPPRGSRFRCATSGPTPAPAGWYRSAARSRRCRDSEKPPRRSMSTSTAWEALSAFSEAPRSVALPISARPARPPVGPSTGMHSHRPGRIGVER